MKRDWNKYINKQKGAECQLVSVLNAYYYLTGKTVKFGSKKYRGLMRLCKAEYGSAICVHRVYERLGMIILRAERHVMGFMGKKGLRLPIIMNIHHKFYGGHSVAIVDYESRTDCFRVPNLKFVTSSGGWIFREDFEAIETRLYSPSGPVLVGMR